MGETYRKVERNSTVRYNQHKVKEGPMEHRRETAKDFWARGSLRLVSKNMKKLTW